LRQGPDIDLNRQLKSSGCRQSSREPKVNYVELIQLQAERVFGNKEKAEAWLNQPKTTYRGSTPIELAHSEAGYQLVKDTLERINQGYAC
jgi:putative toxin-antitoxin system antitoxin component (TIGR02293 family)